MATHHSVSDWDLTGGWTLDTGTYISSPSSMRILSCAGATCKRSEVWNLAQGMIITYAKAYYDWGGGDYNFGPGFGFRNQATSGAGLNAVAVVQYGYTVVINVKANLVHLFLDGTGISNASLAAKPAHANVWNKYRFTWWSDTGGAGLFARLEYWDGSNWVKMINDLTHSENKYKDSTVNRVSISSYNRYDVWLDDTEIWGV